MRKEDAMPYPLFVVHILKCDEYICSTTLNGSSALFHRMIINIIVMK
ncbi:hypothetical protein [Bacillus rhizoplanae]